MALTATIGLIVIGTVALAANAARIVAVPDADDPSALVADVQRLRGILPQDDVVGYLKHAIRRNDADVVKRFYLAQYALAPTLLVRSVEAEYVMIVMPDHDAATDPRLDGFTRIVRSGSVRVFRRTAR